MKWLAAFAVAGILCGCGGAGGLSSADKQACDQVAHDAASGLSSIRDDMSTSDANAASADAVSTAKAIHQDVLDLHPGTKVASAANGIAAAFDASGSQFAQGHLLAGTNASTKASGPFLTVCKDADK